MGNRALLVAALALATSACDYTADLGTPDSGPGGLQELLGTWRKDSAVSTFSDGSTLEVIGLWSFETNRLTRGARCIFRPGPTLEPHVELSITANDTTFVVNEEKIGTVKQAEFECSVLQRPTTATYEFTAGALVIAQPGETTFLLNRVP